MRQDLNIRPILDMIEDDEMFIKINEMYQASRLSDLARPFELREVDMVCSYMQEVLLYAILKYVLFIHRISSA